MMNPLVLPAGLQLAGPGSPMFVVGNGEPSDDMPVGSIYIDGQSGFFFNKARPGAGRDTYDTGGRNKYYLNPAITGDDTVATVADAITALNGDNRIGGVAVVPGEDPSNPANRVFLPGLMGVPNVYQATGTPAVRRELALPGMIEVGMDSPDILIRAAAFGPSTSSITLVTTDGGLDGDGTTVVTDDGGSNLILHIGNDGGTVTAVPQDIANALLARPEFDRVRVVVGLTEKVNDIVAFGLTPTEMSASPSGQTAAENIAAADGDWNLTAIQELQIGDTITVQDGPLAGVWRYISTGWTKGGDADSQARQLIRDFIGMADPNSGTPAWGAEALKIVQADDNLLEGLEAMAARLAVIPNEGHVVAINEAGAGTLPVLSRFTQEVNAQQFIVRLHEDGTNNHLSMVLHMSHDGDGTIDASGAFLSPMSTQGSLSGVEFDVSVSGTGATQQANLDLVLDGAFTGTLTILEGQVRQDAGAQPGTP